jgi:hypothetical protein
MLPSPYDTTNVNWKPAFLPSIQQIKQAMILEGKEKIDAYQNKVI